MGLWAVSGFFRRGRYQKVLEYVKNFFPEPTEYASIMSMLRIISLYKMGDENWNLELKVLELNNSLMVFDQPSRRYAQAFLDYYLDGEVSLHELRGLRKQLRLSKYVKKYLSA